MTAIKFYGKLTQEEIDKNEEGEMAFCRRMKMPNTGTEKKEGTGFGDLSYAPWEKNNP